MRFLGGSMNHSRRMKPGLKNIFRSSSDHSLSLEDHSISAGDFEGVHAGAERGTGAVIIWDEGEFELLRDEPAHLSFVLQGTKLEGRFGLTRTSADQWLLVKARDEFSREGSSRSSCSSLSSGGCPPSDGRGSAGATPRFARCCS